MHRGGRGVFAVAGQRSQPYQLGDGLIGQCANSPASPP